MHSSNLIHHDDVDGDSGGESNGGGAHDGSNDDDDVEEAPRDTVKQGGLLQTIQLAHLTLLMPLLLGSWVLPCFKWFLTILINCKFRTRRFCATSKTCPV